MAKEWTKSDVSHMVEHVILKYKRIFYGLGRVCALDAFDLTEPLPMQKKKHPNPKSDLRAMYLNKSGSTFWYQIFVVCNLFF